MVNPAILKGLVALIGVATVGGRVFMLSNISNKTPNTVAYHFENTKKLRLISSLLSSEINSQWDAEYKLDKEEIKKVVQDISSDDSNGGSRLREWCESQLSREFKTNEDLSKVERWCTIGKISQRIPRGKTLINGEIAEWDGVYTANTELTDRNKLELSTNREQSTKNDDLAKIKRFCEDTKDKDFLAKSKSDEYDVFVKWCVNPN